MPLEQLLHDEQIPETRRLLKCSGMKNISLIADQKGNFHLCLPLVFYFGLNSQLRGMSLMILNLKIVKLQAICKSTFHFQVMKTFMHTSSMKKNWWYGLRKKLRGLQRLSNQRISMWGVDHYQRHLWKVLLMLQLPRVLKNVLTDPEITRQDVTIWCRKLVAFISLFFWSFNVSSTGNLLLSCDMQTLFLFIFAINLT